MMAQTSTSQSRPRFGVILLAAGRGKRMVSQLPKVLHEVGDQPMLFHILDRVRDLATHEPQFGTPPVAVVVGHGREAVVRAVRETPRFRAMPIEFVVQNEQLGTGHAARCAVESPWGETVVKQRLPLMVLPGDLPLITGELLRQMAEPLASSIAMRMLTCELENPFGYGRVVRRGKRGPVLKIKEERDATGREKLIREVATSIYVFQSAFLKAGLARLSNKNAQGEYYLTDLVALAAGARKKIEVLGWTEPGDVRGINDLWELSQAAAILNHRLLKKWALHGVRFADPLTTWVSSRANFEPGASIGPGTSILGESTVSRDATIGAHCVLRDTLVGEGSEIKVGTVCERATIGAQAKVGPHAHLRPESHVGDRAKIGNFVELKKARIAMDTSIAHLSYLGDAEVGARVNIGCGFVTCNYDGRTIDGQRKHVTVIEDDAFIGSDCQTVAPVRIGRGAYVASGSTITEDVGADALAIARARQTNKPGYALRLRERGD